MGQKEKTIFYKAREKQLERISRGLKYLWKHAWECGRNADADRMTCGHKGTFAEKGSIFLLDRLIQSSFREGHGVREAGCKQLKRPT